MNRKKLESKSRDKKNPAVNLKTTKKKKTCILTENKSLEAKQ